MYLTDLLNQCAEILDPLTPEARARVESAVSDYWDEGVILDRDAITILALQQAPAEYTLDDEQFQIGERGDARMLPIPKLGFIPAPRTAGQREAIARKIVEARQARVDAALERGAAFVLSNAGKVHTLECGNSGYIYDQATVREIFGEGSHGPQFVDGQLVASALGGYMPAESRLLTREEVIALPTRYNRCRLCAPDVPERARPRATDEPWTLARIDESLAKPGYAKSKPHQALAALVTAHRSPRLQPCPVDGQPWPCSTIELILDTYGADVDAEP